MRLRPSLLRFARATDRHLLALLPICRNLQSARNELRWLKEHAREQSPDGSRPLFGQYVRRRALGEPLQYILGSEYFGNLKIKCRPGVLIPRHRLKASTMLDTVGIDVSKTALQLAEDNLATQIRLQRATKTDEGTRRESLEHLKFLKADVMRKEDDTTSVVRALRQHTDLPLAPEFDVLISNPPYISTKAFSTTTARSVRQFEPKLALVPRSSDSTGSRHEGDVFYPRIVALADELQAKVMLLEVADMEQALRVAAIVSRSHWDGVEIWRDEPATASLSTVTIGDSTVKVRGDGHGRSVFAYRGTATSWLGSQFL
ncbi:hypothetical protein LTR97_003864 [Elasticomyces elasticus]|uniref:Type II methyltransferase M.TaqI-like domain-containing protein n=1 Tax=Elasticomyces elasticus TaxID=574655 RepID=A0AAN8A413_9PEZI|nr:hypothetical protein LTR97_003864 [Elasticomyces elasticus]